MPDSGISNERPDLERPDLERYAPRIALEWLLRDRCARHMSVDGTLGFFDLSGFTRLSERLGRAGRIGVENVNTVVNRLYSGIIEPAVQHGGDVLQFSGDAILVLFTGPDHEAHAAAAAHQMQRFLATDGRVETEMGAVRLRMSVGMHTGRFELVLLGEQHRFLLAFGPDVTAVCQFEKDAEPGEVLCSERLMLGVPEAARGRATRNGYLLNRRARINVEPVQAFAPIAPDHAETFLFPDLRGKLETAREIGGHRAITAAFIGVRGTDALVAELGPAGAADRLHAVSCIVEAAVEEFDLTWTTTDALPDGCHFMLTSQLLRTHEDDNDRMLLLARRVLDADTGLRLAVGVNYGRVFVGDAGHPQRRVFTGFGDAINLAARVMNYAPDGVALATPAVLERTRVPFTIDAMPPFKAKGKTALVETSAIGAPLGTRRAERDDTGAMIPFVGRAETMQALNARLQELRNGRSAVIDIVGDAGLGKSRLVSECRTGSRDIWRTVVAEPYARATPYGAIRPLMRATIGVGPELDRHATGAALKAWCAQHAPDLEPWLPLLALVVDADVAATSEVDRLEPEFVRGRLHTSVAALVGAAATEPMVVVIEDAHWLDDASLELVQFLSDHARKLPVLWIFTRRPELSSIGVERAETIVLQPLTAAETRELAIEVARDHALATDRLDDVVSRAGGNPLFASELAMAAPFASELPESVEQVAAARIDALPIEHRALLRDASVLGTLVSLDLLAEVRGEPCGPNDPRWKTLADYLEPTRSGDMRFKHELLRVAAYEGLPYRHRQEIHARTGALLEARADPEESGRLAPILAFHFHTARRFDRSWTWAQRAASDASKKSAFYEAARHYEQALEAARHLDDVSDTEMAETAERLGDVDEQLGRFDAAITRFATARKLRVDNAVVVARMYRKGARVQSELGNHTQALRTVSRALSYINDADPAGTDSAIEAERAQLLLVYSINRYFQGKLREAIRFASDALAVAQGTNDTRAVAQAHLQLATFYSDIGDARQALHQDEAMRWFLELGDDIGRGKLLTNMGIDATDAADWTVALDRFAESAAAFERAGNEIAAWTARNNASEMLTDQGHNDEARAILVEARRVFAAAGQRFNMALVVSGLSRIELRAGNLEEAERLNEQALELCTELGIRPYMLDTEVRRVEWLVFAGRPDEALAKAEELVVAIEQEEATSGPTGNLLLTLERFCMWAQLARGHFYDAAHIGERLVKAAQGAGAVYEEALGYDGLAIIAERTGADAQPARAAADRLLERLGVVRTPAVPISTVRK